MIFGANKEGASACEQLAKDLSTLNSDIEACGEKLYSKITSLGENLGEFEAPILELVQKVNSAQGKGRDAVTLLTQKLTKRAADITAVIQSLS